MAHHDQPPEPTVSDSREPGDHMQDQVDILIMQLDTELDLPRYAHPGDAGADLRISEDIVLEPGERRLVGTGVAIAIPDGFVGLVHPRSGLAARHGLTIVNAPGTVDAGYRGEIKVCLLNTDIGSPITLSRGDRIAQLLIQRVGRARFVPVPQLPGSIRGSDGHGSTGGMPATESVEPSAPSTDTKNRPLMVDAHTGAGSAEPQEKTS